MHELDGGGAFAHGRGDPLDGPVPDVPGGEHAGDAGLEQQRRPLQRPAGRQLARPVQVPAGADESLVVSLDGAGEPGGAGLGTDHHEQRGGGHGLGGAADPLPQCQALQAALAVAAGDLSGRADADVGRLADLGDQIAGHAGGQAGTAHHHRDRRRVLGQVDRGLAGRIAGADDIDVLARHGASLRGRRAVEDPGADQGLQFRHAEAAPGDAGGDDDRAGLDLTAGGVHDERCAVGGQAIGRTEREAGPEQPRLVDRPHGQVIAGQAVGEPEVVADQGTRAGLPTGHFGLQHHRCESLGRRVDRGRQARGPGADDGHVAGPRAQGRWHAQRGQQVLVRRVDEHGPVHGQDHGEGRALQAVLAQQPPPLL